MRILAGAKANAGVQGSWIVVELTIKLMESCKCPRGSSVSKCFVMKKLPLAAEFASPDAALAALALITLAEGFVTHQAPPEQPPKVNSSDQAQPAWVQTSNYHRLDSPVSTGTAVGLFSSPTGVSSRQPASPTPLQTLQAMHSAAVARGDASLRACQIMLEAGARGKFRCVRAHFANSY